MSSFQSIDSIRASAEQQANTLFTASGSSSVPAIKVEDTTTSDTVAVKAEPVDDDTPGEIADAPADTTANTPVNSTANTPAGKLEGFYNARGDFETLYLENPHNSAFTGQRTYRSFKKAVDQSGTNRVTGKKMYRFTEPSDKYIEDMGKNMPSGITDRLPSTINDAAAGDEVHDLLSTIATDTAAHAVQTAPDPSEDVEVFTHEYLAELAEKTKAAKEAQKVLDDFLANEAAKKGNTTPARRTPQKKITSTDANVPATPSRHTRASSSRLNITPGSVSDPFMPLTTSRRNISSANDGGMSDNLTDSSLSASRDMQPQMSDVFAAPTTPASQKRKASIIKPASEKPMTPSALKRTRTTAQLDSPEETSPEQVAPPTPTPSRKKVKLNVRKPPTPEPALPKLKLKRTVIKPTGEAQQTATPESDKKFGSATDTSNNEAAAPSTPAPARRSARANKAPQIPGGYGGDDSDSDSDDERNKPNNHKRNPSPVGKRRTRKRKSDDDDDDASDANASDDAASPSPAMKGRTTPKKAPVTPRNKKVTTPRTPKTPGLKKDGSAKKTPKETIPKSYQGVSSQKGYSVPAPDVPNALTTPWRCGNLACTSGMTWLPRDAEPSSNEGPVGRKVISQYFGRNKASTKLIPDDVWHYFCRKDYQRHTYDAKKSGPAFANFVITQVRDQLSRLELYRPDALFEVALSKGAQDRLATFQAIKSANGNDATVAASKMPQPKKANPTPEEATSPALLERFNQQYVSHNNMGGTMADYDRLEAILVFTETEIATGNTDVIIPFEFLIQAPADGEIIDDTDNFEKWRCQKQNIVYPDMSGDDNDE